MVELVVLDDDVLLEPDELPESDEELELPEPDELPESDELPELAAASFLVEELPEPLSLLSASRVDPNVPADRLSVL